MSLKDLFLLDVEKLKRHFQFFYIKTSGRNAIFTTVRKIHPSQGHGFDLETG
jgi:hypothetical protein